nr:MAG TPA: hypothetical protein [Bacteriophage sp.]
MNRTSYSYFSIIIFIFYLGIIKIFIRKSIFTFLYKKFII